MGRAPAVGAQLSTTRRTQVDTAGEQPSTLLPHSHLPNSSVDVWCAAALSLAACLQHGFGCPCRCCCEPSAAAAAASVSLQGRWMRWTVWQVQQGPKKWRARAVGCSSDQRTPSSADGCQPAPRWASRRLQPRTPCLATPSKSLPPGLSRLGLLLLAPQHGGMWRCLRAVPGVGSGKKDTDGNLLAAIDRWSAQDTIPPAAGAATWGTRAEKNCTRHKSLFH